MLFIIDASIIKPSNTISPLMLSNAEVNM